jgi:CHRD domain
MRGKALTLGLCAVFGLGLGLSGCNDATQDMEVFEAVLSGQSEVPVRASAGNGRVQFVSDGSTITYSVEMDDLSNLTQGHIHLAAAGVNGPVRVFLYPFVTSTSSGPATSFSDKQVIAKGVITQTNILAGVTMAQLLEAMRNGGAYANFHTTQFPGGEIRGQIQRVNVD